MSTFIAQDGTRIDSKNWGAGQLVTFRHGWPRYAGAPHGLAAPHADPLRADLLECIGGE